MEAVVKFEGKMKDGNIRRVTMYFEEKDGDLDMSMACDPELKDNEAPDLPMLLASTLLQALRSDSKEDESSKVYDGNEN